MYSIPHIKVHDTHKLDTDGLLLILLTFASVECCCIIIRAFINHTHIITVAAIEGVF